MDEYRSPYFFLSLVSRVVGPVARSATELRSCPTARRCARSTQVYTILKVYYKLTIHNPRTGSNNGAVVITCEQSRTGGDQEENRSIINGNIYEYLGLEHHKRYSNGPGTNDGGDKGSFTIIEGTYKPGQFKRNAVNDSDVRTWIPVASTPDLIDDLFIAFFEDPLRHSTKKQHLNCSLEMKTVVQFKDLKEAFRYPSRQTTPISLVAPSDFRHFTLNPTGTFFNSSS